MQDKLCVDSGVVGAPWKPVHRTITWRQTTNYAAATGDMNPRYLDDEREGGIIAPPMFAVTLGWPIGQSIRENVELSWPDEALKRDVHYTEYIEFEQPIRPGEQGVELVVQPVIQAVIPQRSGTNVVYKYEVRGKDGSLYHTEYNGTLLRGVSCPDGGRGEAPQPPRTSCEQPVWEHELYVKPEQTYLYDAATDIVFPIHTSPKYAHSVDLPNILLTGTITIAIGVREVVNRELDGEAPRIKAIGAKLTAMIFPDSTIKVQLLEKRETPEHSEFFFRVLNQEGAVALSHGYVKVLNHG